MKNKKIFGMLTFLMSFVFIISSLLLNVYARKINDYSIHNSGVFGFRGSWDYQKNNDEENSITLVKCKSTGKTKLTSPIDSHDITRVGKNFSFVKQTEDNHRADKFVQVLLMMTIIMAPFAIMMNDSGRLNRVDYYDHYSDIFSVDLPKCTLVEENGFKNNKNLVTVKLPSCKKIDKNAFLDCNGISSMSVPMCDSVSESAFCNNSNLKSFIGSKNYKVIEDRTFENCFELHKIGNLEIMEKLGNRSFYRTNIQNLNLKSCKYVGDECFSGCKNLYSIELPVCEFMGNRVFYGNEKIMPNRWPSPTGRWCGKLKNIYLPVCKSVGYQCFSKTAIQEVDFPVCESVGNKGFSGCEGLKNVKLPLCKNIGEYTFLFEDNGVPGSRSQKREEWFCSNLKSVYLPKCSLVGKGAFEGCKLLEEVDLSSCEEIEPYVFKGCSKINSGMKIFNNIEKLGMYAFEECVDLEKISLENCKILEDGVLKIAVN